MNLDRFSTTWISAWPSPDCLIASSANWLLDILVSPVLLAACLLASRSDVLHPHGCRLTTAPLPGDGYRRQHDAVKWWFDEDLKELGIWVRTKVYGLVAAVLPQQARNTLAAWPARKRHLVPDFTIALPEVGQSPSDAAG